MVDTQTAMNEIMAAQKRADFFRKQCSKKIFIDSSNIFQKHLLIDTIYISQFKWSRSFIVNTKYLEKLSWITKYNNRYKGNGVNREVLCVSPNFEPVFSTWIQDTPTEIPIDIVNLIKLFCNLSVEWIFFA